MTSAATGPSQRGGEVARMVRRSRGLQDTRAINLDEILEEVGILVTESERADPGYAAVLIRLQGGGAGIMLAASQTGERRRFSLAHEIGHYCIPSHASQGPTLRCAEADLRVRSTDAAAREWEANDFAAEFLMPRRLFFEDAKHRPIDFETVGYLADPQMYQVSRTAAAWRLVQTTREACAIVASIDGAIAWVARSAAFRHWIPERGQPVGSGTIAAAINRGERPSSAAEEVNPSEWFDDVESDGIAVFESAHSVPSQGQVISLVWVRERERGGGDDD
jgi:Zn-dependent peptidase ImmA (M78 family)